MKSQDHVYNDAMRIFTMIQYPLNYLKIKKCFLQSMKQENNFIRIHKYTFLM